MKAALQLYLHMQIKSNSQSNDGIQGTIFPLLFSSSIQSSSLEDCHILEKNESTMQIVNKAEDIQRQIELKLLRTLLFT